MNPLRPGICVSDFSIGIFQFILHTDILVTSSEMVHSPIDAEYTLVKVAAKGRWATGKYMTLCSMTTWSDVASFNFYELTPTWILQSK